ncbi:DNA topoisomerase IV subunit A [Mycoplasma sp. Ms02]|uniref:DNA topoisomerase IV subunit A n=1 Tax=Mycoplasma sp. Ms02 TaxID=353851 RepID=UPI0021040A0C|nr:DNA topoisomerase IV subunit A [Mycoplasma sp. Ms02]
MKKEQIIEKIINESLDNIMAERFGRYSKYIIQNRALPDVRDGLKPVQRRILFAMHELGLEWNKPYKKSARVVGDVIGKYHPHGDSSVYEAMVNMSQWWKSNVRLLDMHGNVGSIDNDPAAAMRYTEVKMSKIAAYMLGDIKKKTVDFIPNFDDSEKEPVVLPALFPNLLVNGTTGIAIGMSTEMPSHNLSEVINAAILLIKKPESKVYDLMKYIKGPDFPTGGVIYGQKGIIEAFEQGKMNKERIKIFSKYEIVKKDKNKQIIITEIPYGVVKSQLVYEIDVLIQNSAVDGIQEIRDESDREGIKIAITLDKDANEQSILSYLFSKTQLQVNYSYNNVAIVNNAPKLLNLREILQAYIDHVKEVKTKTLSFDLEKQKLRLEIVEGFLKVAEITDEIIEVIRKTEGSKSGVITNLMERFGFSQIQATAIAEMKLYRLSKTDKSLYEAEKADLEKEIARITLLLTNENEFKKYIISVLNEIKDLFHVDRKTTIYEHEFDFSYDEKDLIKEEIVNIAISKHGYIKRLSQKTIDSNEFKNFVLKEDDYLTFYNKVNTMHTFLIFTNLGNYAIIPIHKITENKWKDLGTHLTDFVDLKVNEVVVSVIEVSNWDVNEYVVLATKYGQLKKTLVADFKVSRTLKTYTAMNLNADDELVNACLSDGNKDVILITSFGLCTKYSENEVSVYGAKAKGNKGCYLMNNDYISAFTVALSNDVLTFITAQGKLKKIRAKDIAYVIKTNKGKELFKNNKVDGHIVTDIYATRDTDSLLLRDTLGFSYLDNVKDYSFSKANTSFLDINIDNFSNGVIRKTQRTTETIFELTREENKKSDKVFEDAQKVINGIDLNLDDLLARIDKSIKEKSGK